MSELPWVTLFAVIALTIAIVAVVFSILLRNKQMALANAITICSDQMRALTNSTIGVGKRVIDVENELQKLAYSQQNIPLTDPLRSTYHHASALLNKGASVDEVVRTCEISRAEADFLHKMAAKFS